MTDLINLSELDEEELTKSGIPVKELKNAGAIEFGVELIEGLYEILEIVGEDEKKSINRVIFMIEAFLECDFNCAIEKVERLKLDS